MRYHRMTGEFPPVVDLPLSDEHCAQFLAMSSNLHCILDDEGSFLFLNAAWSAALGYSLEELRLQPLLHWVHPEDRDTAAKSLMRAHDGETQAGLEHRLVAYDGRAVLVRWSWQRAAKQQQLLGSGVDMTAARAEATFHKNAVDAVETGVMIIDSAGQIVLVNRKFESMFGYARQHIVGKSVHTVVPAAVGLARSSQSAKTPATPGPQHFMAGEFDQLGIRKDGSQVQVEIHVNPVATTTESYLLASIVDITDRVRQEEQLRANLAELRRHRHEMLLLTEMSSLLQHAVAASEAYAIVSSFAPRLFPDLPVAVYAIEPDHHLLQRVVAVGDQGEDAGLDPNDCWALRRGQVHRSAPGAPPECGHRRMAAGQMTMCIPMAAHGRNQGLLAITADLGRLDPQSAGALESLGKSVADQLALALSSLDLRERLHRLSVRDPLTDLYNRRFLDEAGERELSRARRHGQCVSVLLLDCDNFKAFNDSHGHLAGDAALRELAQLLRANSRKEDIVCRFGGEEFMIILAATDRAKAAQQAERLRIACQAETHGRLTVSIGVAVFPDDATGWISLLSHADAALYQAKAAGRNCVKIFSASPDPVRS